MSISYAILCMYNYAEFYSSAHLAEIADCSERELLAQHGTL